MVKAVSHAKEVQMKGTGKKYKAIVLKEAFLGQKMEDLQP